MTTEKTGTCEHGEFILSEGCPQCIAKKSQAAQAPAFAVIPDNPDDQEAADFLTEQLSIAAPEIMDAAVREAVAETMGVPDTEIAPAQQEKPSAEALRIARMNQEPGLEDWIPGGHALIQIGPEADAKVKALYQEATHLLELAEARVITENADLKSATEDLSVIARLKKALNEKKDEFVKPVRTFLNGFNDTFKTMLEPIEEADRITRDKMKGFKAEQQRKIAEAQAIEDEKMALAQREAELTGGEISVDLTPVEAPPPVPERVRTDIGMAGTAKVYKWEVTDKAAVPDEYKVVDAGAVGRVVKASKGSIVIAGIRIWEEDTIRVTTR